MAKGEIDERDDFRLVYACGLRLVLEGDEGRPVGKRSLSGMTDSWEWLTAALRVISRDKAVIDE